MNPTNRATPSTNVSEAARVASPSNLKTITESSGKGTFGSVLKGIVAELSLPPVKPGSGNATREIGLNSISAGNGEQINIRLGSGGGFADVTLSKNGAKFTMSTPAYFKDSPGITTQNTLEFDVDFSDLSPKKHSQLVNELKSALEESGSGDLNKSEAALVSDALEILNDPDVCKACTVQSGVEALAELIEKLLQGAGPDELHDCKKGFEAISAKPKPAIDTYELPREVGTYASKIVDTDFGLLGTNSTTNADLASESPGWKTES